VIQRGEESAEISDESVDGSSRQLSERVVLDREQSFDEPRDLPAPDLGERQDASAPIIRVWTALDPSGRLEPVQSGCEGAGTDHHRSAQITRSLPVRVPPQTGQHVDVRCGQPVRAEDVESPDLEEAFDPGHPPEQRHAGEVPGRVCRSPCGDDAVDVIRHRHHDIPIGP
jgi:hypothetical protein